MENLCSDDLRVALTALRDLLAVRLVGAEPRESAPLARQLREVLTVLASLAEPEESGLDDLAARRAGRRAETQVSAFGDGVVGGA